MMMAASLVPVIVIVIVCDAVPSNDWTVKVSRSVSPGASASTVVLALSSSYSHAPVASSKVKVP